MVVERDILRQVVGEINGSRMCQQEGHDTGRTEGEDESDKVQRRICIKCIMKPLELT